MLEDDPHAPHGFRLEVNDIRENHKAITSTTNASKSRLQLTQREISPTHHTLILNGFSNAQKASITQHGPRTACAGCIESQNGGIFFAALQAKSAYKTGYWEHLRALVICGVGQLPYLGGVGAKALEVGEKSIGKLSIDPDGPAVGPTLAGAPLPRTPRDGRRTGVIFLPQFSTSRSPLSNR